MTPRRRQVSVFDGRAVGSFDRILGGVLSGLLNKRGLKVDLQHIRKPQKVGEDIRDFLPDVSSSHRVCHHRSGLISSQPLEDLGKLTNLPRKGHDKVLRGMELFPIALRGEVPEETL